MRLQWGPGNSGSPCDLHPDIEGRFIYSYPGRTWKPAHVKMRRVGNVTLCDDCRRTYNIYEAAGGFAGMKCWDYLMACAERTGE